MQRGYWQQVLDSDMAVPAERPLNELTAELVTMLGSVNPVERDHTAYPVLASWLAEGVYDDLLISLGDSVAQGLLVGLGEARGDSVFRRSFSALVLAECIARDNVAHLLPVDAVLNWAERAVSWYTREQDLRGWVPDKGWAHSVAHGADLIAVLASSRHLQQPHLGVLLDVIAERVVAATPTVLVDGEDDRLATAALTVVQRNLVEADQLDLWVDLMGQTMERTSAPTSHPTWPTPANKNTSAFLRALHVHLAAGMNPTDATVSFNAPPACRSDLLLALLRNIPRLTPWLYPAPPQGL